MLQGKAVSGGGLFSKQCFERKAKEEQAVFATKWDVQACHLWCQCGGIIIVVVTSAFKEIPITCSGLSLTDVFIRIVSRWAPGWDRSEA